MCQSETNFPTLNRLMNLGLGFLLCGAQNVTFNKESIRVESLKLPGSFFLNKYLVFFLQKQSKDRFGLEGDEESTMLEESVSPKKYVKKTQKHYTCQATLLKSIQNSFRCFRKQYTVLT